MTIAYKIKLIEIPGIKQSELIITFITNLLLRNCGLMSIVTILAYNNDLKIRRVMDLIQINMRANYYGTFDIKDYSVGLHAYFYVNGIKKDVTKEYQ
jgi:hypothetical protein